jgi:hypothetical protein
LAALPTCRSWWTRALGLPPAIQFSLHQRGRNAFPPAGLELNGNPRILRLLAPLFSTTSLLVRWQSVSGQSYSLGRSTNPRPQSNFVLVANGLIGQPGESVFADTNAVGEAPFLYRVLIQD